MTRTIHAVYENGVFRPTEAVDLPEMCEVELDVRRLDVPTTPALEDVDVILGRKRPSLEPDS